MTKKAAPIAVRIPEPSFEDAPSPGTAYGGSEAGKAYRIPEAADWQAYDQFICGSLRAEISRSLGRTLEEVSADIQFMRDQMRLENPGASDIECDAIRRESILIKAGVIDGSAPGLARFEAAHKRLYAMQQAIANRNEAIRRNEIP